MHGDHFLFQTGTFLGSGTIEMPLVEEPKVFHTKWEIEKIEPLLFRCKQTVEMAEGEKVVNHFEVIGYEEKKFDILLENELIGSFLGKGVIDEKVIAWEFREKGEFEGFEVYTLEGDRQYSFKAEYLSSDQEMRTHIAGKLWKKGE